MSSAFDIQGETIAQRGGSLTSGDKTFGDGFGGIAAREFLAQKGMNRVIVSVAAVAGVTAVLVALISRGKRRGK